MKTSSLPSRARRCSSFSRLASVLLTLSVYSASPHLHAQFSLTGMSYSQSFDSLGTSATATLPTGWKFGNTTTYSFGVTATTVAGGTTGTNALGAGSTGGYYNFGNGVTASATDRAAGFLGSSSFTGSRYLLFGFTNNTGSTLADLTLTFDLEKYRNGSRDFDIGFASSTNGTTWTSYAAAGQHYTGGGSGAVNPPATTSKSITLTALNLTAGSSLYFYWSYTGVGGSNNAQAIGVDNVSLAATAVPEPSTYAAVLGSAALLAAWLQRRHHRRGSSSPA